MADYLYILNDYKACADLYDRCNFLEDASWLNKYFYSLRQLGKFEEALEKFHYITEKIKIDVLDEQSNPSNFEDEEDYVFKCDYCECRFSLSVDTYHGSGGSWKVMDC